METIIGIILVFVTVVFFVFCYKIRLKTNKYYEEENK